MRVKGLIIKQKREEKRIINNMDQIDLAKKEIVDLILDR